jgi:hypothetical protein
MLCYFIIDLYFASFRSQMIYIAKGGVDAHLKGYAKSILDYSVALPTARSSSCERKYPITGNGSFSAWSFFLTTYLS